MILFQIDPDRVLALPFEGDAPGPVYVDGVADRLAAQAVEVEAGGCSFARDALPR